MFMRDMVPSFPDVNMEILETVFGYEEVLWFIFTCMYLKKHIALTKTFVKLPHEHFNHKIWFINLIICSKQNYE